MILVLLWCFSFRSPKWCKQIDAIKDIIETVRPFWDSNGKNGSKQINAGHISGVKLVYLILFLWDYHHVIILKKFKKMFEISVKRARRNLLNLLGWKPHECQDILWTHVPHPMHHRLDKQKPTLSEL